MKKIIFILIIGSLFLNKVNGNVLEGEYHYRFYKEEIMGEYLKKGSNSEYEYEDINNIKYGDYSEYQYNCIEDEYLDTEYATYYKYKDVYPIKYIKFENPGTYELEIEKLEIIHDGEYISYNFVSCAECNNNIINKESSLTIELEKEVKLTKLELYIKFVDTGLIRTIKILYSRIPENDANYYIASKSATTMSTYFKYPNNFYIYPNYTPLQEGYNIEENNLMIISKKEKVCRQREVLTYHYNVFRDYFDDNYYSDINELPGLSEKEKLQYKMDLNDYKIIDINNKYNNKLELVNTGVVKEEKNYKYLNLFILTLILITLLIIKRLRKMSIKNEI